ncbi:MAG TPA: hypothetical protein VFS00_08275, partial [Polyangiaceae bacterium]|nr:hypothetical protein [Polyangiaceae bacterium]
ETRHTALQLAHPRAGQTIDVDLDVGEALLFKGDAIPHRRTPLVEGEFARLLSLGFMLTCQQQAAAP